MKKTYFAIDIGASGGRGVAGFFDGNRLTLSVVRRFPNAYIIKDGSYYWDAIGLFNEIKDTIVRGASVSPCSVGIDTWGVDFGCIGYDGKLRTMPYNYRDPRVINTPEKIHGVFPRERYYALTGIQSIASNTVYQLYEDLVCHPNELAEVCRILLMPDLFNYLLTGIPVCEYTITSTGGMFDVWKKDFADELLNKLDIPLRVFSTVVMPGNRLGGLSKAVAEETGASMQVVNVAEHDTASAVLAVPQTDPEHIYISSGTWSLMGINSDKPVVNEKARQYNFTNEGGAFGAYRFLKNLAGLGLIHESRRWWDKEGYPYSFDRLAEMAEDCGKYAYLIDPDDALFLGAEDIPSLIRQYCNDTGQKEPVSNGGIVRCIYDSLALSYRRCASMLSEITGRHFNCIHIVGGGSRDSLLCQLTADVTGLLVYAGPAEASATGNLLVQAYASGEIGSAEDIKHIVRASFDIKLYEPNIHLAAEADEAYNRWMRIIEKRG